MPGPVIIVLVLVVVLVLDIERGLGMQCRNNPELASMALAIATKAPVVGPALKRPPNNLVIRS